MCQMTQKHAMAQRVALYTISRRQKLSSFTSMLESGMLFAYLVGRSDKLLQKMLTSPNWKEINEGGAGV